MIFSFLKPWQLLRVSDIDTVVWISQLSAMYQTHFFLQHFKQVYTIFLIIIPRKGSSSSHIVFMCVTCLYVNSWYQCSDVRGPSKTTFQIWVPLCSMEYQIILNICTVLCELAICIYFFFTVFYNQICLYACIYHRFFSV